MSVVSCVKYHLCSGCIAAPRGYGRLVKTDDTLATVQIPNEGYFDSGDFEVTSSTNVEATRWDGLGEGKGYYV